MNELLQTAVMLETHAPEIFPKTNAAGQKDLARVMMESAAEAIREALKLRPLSEWHEDMGPKLWWKFPLSEAPYVGSPLDLGHTVEVVTRYVGRSEDGETCPVVEQLTRHQIGGWPGYHTHFSDIPTPEAPNGGGQ